MSVLDPSIKFLQQEVTDSGRLKAFDDAVESGLEGTAARPVAKLLVQFTGDIAALEKAGFQTRSVAGDVATGTARLNAVNKLAELPGVTRMELARTLTDELDNSVSEIRADLVHTGPPSYRGSGVLLGIIDSGIDITHESFRRADGSTRVLSIWDQTLGPESGESSPTGFTYGVEYSDTDIDASIAAGGPPNTVRHRDGDDTNGHGTHVAGIAAGDGSSAGSGRPAFTFVGVAPEADLIIVRNDAFGGGGRGMGDSANTLDAVSYIFGRAAALNRPVVINLSQGDNIGPHDGTSLLERGIDNLLGGQGRCMVKSAGNEGNRSRHASGTVAPAGTENIRFNGPANNQWRDIIDVWYDGVDRIGVSFTAPDGNTSAVVNAGTTTSLALANGNRVFVDSALNDPNNGDNRIFVRIERGSSSAIQAGSWTMNLIGTTVSNGRFDAWIDRNIRPVPTFTSHVDASGTLSIPGTSSEVITAGSYITSGAGVGSLSSFSSRGPTRDGRNAPTISAPGQWITSARASGIANGSGPYHAIQGTSMAAPHVAGVVALMLEANPAMSQSQVTSCLRNNARSDAFTGAVPNDDWGAGKIDARNAVDCPGPPTLKFVDDQEPPTLKFRDDQPPTLKFRDDQQPTLKFRDDQQPPTLKFRDDQQPTLKFRDDQQPPTLKFRDDQQPPTVKFADDIGTRPDIDLVKNPGLDGPAQPQAQSAVPFVVSTPHHSNAWAGSFPEAHEEARRELEEMIQAYEAQLGEAQAAYSEGQLSETELQQVEAIYREYERLVVAYRQMTDER